MKIPGVKFSSSGKTMFWSIISGTLVHRVPEGTEGAVKRLTKSNKTVHEIHAASITGKLMNLSVKDTDYGPELEVKLLSEDVAHVISMPWASRYCRSLMERIYYISIGEEITIRPYRLETSEGKKSGISLTTGGIKIESHFRKYENGEVIYLNGFPQPAKKISEMTKREQSMYQIELDEFYERIFKEWTERNHTLNDKVKEQNNDVDEPDKIDSLPF